MHSVFKLVTIKQGGYKVKISIIMGYFYVNAVNDMQCYTIKCLQKFDYILLQSTTK